jgi:hypothetical protein
MDFFSAMQRRSTPLFIEWPEKEFAEMRQYRLATHGQIQEARGLWEKMVCGNRRGSDLAPDADSAAVDH